jgi:hypothetical protein
LSKEVKKFDKLIMSITNNNSIYLQRFWDQKIMCKSLAKHVRLVSQHFH